MNIVFMGTPDFAAISLNKLLLSSHNIVAVVTQPDKPSSRGQIIYSPVKKIALEKNIPLFQFNKIRIDGVDALNSLKPDVIITAAYGQILSKEIIDIPKYGILNVHASLLPAYRGSSPIQWAIINGEKVTGITIMQTNEGLDTGDILLKREVEITSLDTSDTLFDKLAEIGGDLLLECLEKLEKGEITREKQDESKASYYPMLKKENGKLDFSKSALSLDCFIRGVSPWPGAFTYLDGALVKVHKASPSEENGNPGEIIKLDKNGILVGCGIGSIYIMELQFEGKKRMSAIDAINGNKFKVGQFLN